MTRWRWHLLFAAVVGVGLRLFFVLQCPAESGDAPVYEALAANWLQHGTYALPVDGRITPVDIRVPGYPAFLAILYALTGRTGTAARLWVMLAQIVVDLGTCFLAAGLAALLSLMADGRSRPHRAFVAALWLAVTCPFTANYTAVPLTEVLATFFTTAALIPLVMLAGRAQDKGFPMLKKAWAFANGYWFLGILGAVLAGIGTLVRPETPLLLFAFWTILGFLLFLQRRFGRWVQTVLLMALAFAVPLLPWAARNALTLHKLQFLAPRHAELAGELVPWGFIAWEKTWLVRFRDVYLVSWKLDEEPIAMEDIPPPAFDSPEERDRVVALIAKYNESVTITQDLDDAFAQLARERTARYPLRTYLWIPVGRMSTLWFAPRTELLEISGHIWPLGKSWDVDPLDFSISFGFFLLNFAYVGLAAIGAAYLYRASPAGNAGAKAGLALIVLFILVRTVFLTTIETPEPRYVLECIPAVLALAAQTWNRQRSSTGSG
jgi:hypothetical protein